MIYEETAGILLTQCPCLSRPIVQQGAEVKAMERSDGMVVTVTYGRKNGPGKEHANLVFSQLKNVSDPVVFLHTHVHR